MHELPLLIFTCGLELAVGLLAIVAVASFVDKEGNYKVAACISVALAIVAMLGSLLHLGVPLKSVFAITRFGGSPLSNEIGFTGAFVACALLYTALCFLSKVGSPVRNAVAVIGAVVGLGALYMVGGAYANSEVPLWDGLGTYVEPIATALSCGAAIFLALYFKTASKTMMRVAGIVVIGAVAVQAAFAVPEYAELALGSGAAAASAQIIVSSSSVLTAGWILIGIGAAWTAWRAAVSSADASTGLAWGAAGILVVGQVIVRYFFYAAMVATAIGML